MIQGIYLLSNKIKEAGLLFLLSGLIVILCGWIFIDFALIMLGVDSFDGDLGFGGSESITSPRKEKVISLPGDI